MNNPFTTGDEPVFMGIVNVTPDSFSDGGEFYDTEKAILHGLRLHREGAHILDIGGESTRPGATPVHPVQEIARIVPVIEGLRHCGAVLSVDTRNAQTMKAAIEAGATLVNDVSALRHDPDSLHVVAEAGCRVCLMHTQGEPAFMQDSPRYEDVFDEVYAFLEGRIAACLRAGIAKDKIIVDPGIGFGKTTDHNATLLKRVGGFAALGMPVLLGVSRKKFIGDVGGGDARNRLGGSIGAGLSAYGKGVRMFRVHDVAETVQAFKLFRIS